MKTCLSNKRMYPTKEIAEEALIEAHTRFQYSKGSGPIAIYQCDDCGYYHFTSQGKTNEKLAAFLNSPLKKVEYEAFRWNSKLKK